MVLSYQTVTRKGRAVMQPKSSATWPMIFAEQVILRSSFDKFQSRLNAIVVCLKCLHDDCRFLPCKRLKWIVVVVFLLIFRAIFLEKPLQGKSINKFIK